MPETAEATQVGVLKAADAWIEQYAALCEQRAIAASELDPATARMVSRRQALQFGLVPVRWEEGRLEIATTRACLERALNFTLHALTRACQMVLVTEENLNQLRQAAYGA